MSRIRPLMNSPTLMPFVWDLFNEGLGGGTGGMSLRMAAFFDASF